MDKEQKLAEAIAFFNSGRFFDAHEALEDVWREMQGMERRYMQGLVQAAVGLHHHSTGNLEGACSVLARAAANLAGAPDEFCGIAVPPLREALRGWVKALESGVAPPPLPLFETRRR